MAIAGLGGNNAHGAGFLAAAQEVQARHNRWSRPVRRDLSPTRSERAERLVLPELEFVSCTSGAIAATAEYLRGEPLRANLQARITALDRLLGLPRTSWAEPWRSQLVVWATGVPEVFGPWSSAAVEHLRRLWGDAWYRPFSLIPTTPTAWLDLCLPARTLVSRLPQSFFEQTAATFNDPSHGIGVCFNSIQPTTGEEYLYVNEAGLDLIKSHHDPEAEYGGGGGGGRVIYQPVTGTAVRQALALLSYGFRDDAPPGEQHVDGAYTRSIILDELTFADRIYAVKPVNDRWLGRLPRNLLETQDMQTEMWMSISYREQARFIEKINKLRADGRLTEAINERPDGEDTATKTYHDIDLVAVEITVQRGYFAYFIEDLDVFDDAYAASLEMLKARVAQAVPQGESDGTLAPTGWHRLPVSDDGEGT